MNFKKILIALILSSLLIGCVGAVSIQEFKIESPVKEIYASDNCVIYANSHGDAGIGIYKSLDNQKDNKTIEDGPISNLIYDDGDEYITPDNTMKLSINQDHTANFTDLTHKTKGISEIINTEGQKYVVIFWEKSSSDMNMTKLNIAKDNFNNNNEVTPIAFNASK